MKTLIKIETTEKGNQAVSARELHQFLESKQRFADWIKNRIDKYDFEENKDFYKLYFDVEGNLLKNSVHKNMVTDNQEVTKVHKIDYVLTLDMAKELSMIENNDKGRQARKYFIECEKELNRVKLPQTYKEALLELVAKIEENERLQENLKKSEKLVAHKTDVISYLTDDIKLMTQRQFLNEIIRMKGNDNNLIRERWKLLYSFYEKQKKINLSARLESYNKYHKPKLKSKLQLVDEVMNDIPTLYKVAVKTFEADFKDKLNKYIDAI